MLWRQTTQEVSDRAVRYVVWDLEEACRVVSVSGEWLGNRVGCVPVEGDGCR